MREISWHIPENMEGRVGSAHGVELAQDVGRLPGARPGGRVAALRVRARQLEGHLHIREYEFIFSS